MSHPCRAWLVSLRLFLIMLAILGQQAPALAHAALNGSTPLDGSMIEAPPAALSLVFSEPVSPLVLKLLRPDGTASELDKFELRDRSLEIEAPGDLGRGTHVLTWRVVSGDGHPVGGSVVFSIGAPSAQMPALADDIDLSVRSGLWLGKIFLYVGLFIGIGGVFARAFLMQGNEAGRRPVRLALAAGALGAIASLGFQGLDALGRSPAGLADVNVWRAGYATTFGFTTLCVLLGFGAAALAANLQGWRERVLAVLALVLAAGALALSGHASAATPQWLMRPAVFLHAAAVALWIGALLPLGLVLRNGEPMATAALLRFSLWIPPILALLVAAGAVLAVVQLGHPAALVSTAYGNVLLVKLLLVGLLLGLAAANRWRLTGPAAAGDRRAIRRLAASIAAETVIALLVFGTVAAWRFTPPPRSLALNAVKPAVLHVHGEKAMADVTLTPPRAGEISVSALVLDSDFVPLEAKEVSFAFSNSAAAIEPFRRPAVKLPEPGAWQVDGMVLPLAGTWTVRLDILVSDFELVRLQGDVDIE